MNAPLSYWDSQFRFSALIPEFQDCLETMTAASRVVEGAMPRTRFDYGSDPRQWVEISDREEGPIVPVFIHGGYWRALTADDHRFILAGLSGMGPRVGNVEHRLVPNVRIANLIEDVTAGLNRLAAEIGPSSKLVVIGHSAGAHLGMAALQAGAATGRVAGIVGISGIYDLGPIPHSFLQSELSLTDEEVAAASVHHTKTPVPTLLIVGANETPEFQRQAEMVASLHGAPVLRIADTHHMNVLSALADAKGPSIKIIQDWLSTGQLATPICGVSS